ncbi:hypothetical protein IE53DRAFT_24314 [Violaceomyces palustris]|uniref:Uncharacterized protein n=1 Tax=Violaceomyces palustris TaxID=1673888 RepID=A0ACD0P7X9_9BASI|nr:hypothetical protein IE53DRAFT_24314 [Violaceomyces palustris]
MDDDVLEIDSPMEPPVDIEDEEEEEEIAQFSLDGFSRNGVDVKAKGKKNKGEEDRAAHLDYQESLPYACESLQEFDERLAFVIRRLVDCVRTKDYDVGFIQWNHKLQCLLSLKYPIERRTRARLARLYYELAVLPGMDTRLIELAANMCMTLIESKKRITIKDLILPWRPLYNILEKELFPKQRRTGLTNISETLLDLAEFAQRFFPASEADEMLRTFLPKMDGSNLNSVIATQAFLVHFLPISHPQRWLPAMFRLWESFTSSLFDDQMLDLLARLAELHVSDPSISSEAATFEAGSETDPELRPESKVTPSVVALGNSDERKGRGGPGLWKETGIFTDQQYAMIMTKCLRSAGLPVGASKAASAALMAQSSSVRTGPDAAASGNTLKMKKPSDRLHSFAIIIAYSMAKDGPVAGESVSATPLSSSTPSTSTPLPGSSPKLKPLDPAARQSFLAGSKALDHLARFVQATESYFHPSNYGIWQIQLSQLVQHLTFEFLRRAKEEERKDCKTPPEYRLTPLIKREFVSTLRTVCLLSMFSKDPHTIAASQVSLKRMAMLEPDLIFPAVLERSFSSLEALETTHRTTAIISALSTLGPVMVSRQLYRAGGKHLVPLLQLCIPGIDLNDPMKTMSTCMFILLSLLTVRVDDLTRSEVYADDEASDDVSGSQPSMQLDPPEGEERPLTNQQEDYQLRLSTADFESWVMAYFQKVLALFETLPEEGKGGKTGGKIEEQVLNILLAATDCVCGALSPYLFDRAFKMIADYCATTVSATSVRVIGSLVSCFGRADSRKVLERIVPMCSANIRAELAHGASSVRTTSTTLPLPSDAALHWNLSILIGGMSYAGESLLAHRQELLSIMQLTVQSCKSERGFSFAGRLVQRVITTLTGIYPREQRFVNEDVWECEDFQKRSHLYWGKLYQAKDAKINWHVPSDDEIEFALEILDEILVPCLHEVERLQGGEGITRDKVWSNDFCRFLSVVRLSLVGIPHLIEEDDIGGGVEAMDAGDEVPAFIEPPPKIKSGFILTDRSDPRYQKVLAFKNRFGDLMHRAAQTTQDSGAEDQIDCVKLLIRSIRTHLVSYSYNNDDYKSHTRSVAFYRSITKLYAKQKEYPRVLWVRRAALYHTSRARLNSFHRKRSVLADKLIGQVLEFCMSNYVGIRQTAQNTLDTICSYYDGARIICLPRLLESIKPGVSDDRMKGALFVLGSKGFSSLAIIDARFSAPYILGLLEAQHHSKPSIQKLVRGVINDFVIRFAEPSTLKSRIDSPTLTQAAELLEKALPVSIAPTDPMLLDAVVSKRRGRVDQINRFHSELAPRVLDLARNESTHWAFSIFAARLLRAMIRKDQPLTEEPARYLTQQVVSENPKMRRYAQAAVTKVLYFLKLRTLCGSDEDLLLGNTRSPLKRTEKLPSPVPKEWTQSYLEGFAEPISKDTKLRDKSSQGWLVWGDEESYYEVPPESEDIFKWDPTSRFALDAIRDTISCKEWWDNFFRHLSQEKDRDYIAADTTNLIKSLFQVFGASLLDFIKPSVESFIGERDRHKHRAAAEMIGGLYRGSKHWPTLQQDALWAWLGSLLPKIFKECTPDSQPAWQMCVEYMLQNRDPRRAAPLVRYVVNAAKESIGAEATTQSPWEQSKAQNLLRGALIALNLKFTAWGAEDFINIYVENFGHDFQEVRSVISESLADLELLQLHPSFGSVDQLLDECASGSGSLLARPLLYGSRLDTLSKDLAKWREERIPTAQGTSQYDRAAMTALLWISTTLGDHRNSAMAGQVIRFLPDIFTMLELHDNRELSVTARAVLTKISTYPFTSEYVEQMVSQLLNITRSATESWRTRLDSLPILQVFYFQNLFYLDSKIVQQIVELLFDLLRDKHLEVREMAATTLSGIVRCSQRRMIKALKERFTRTVASTKLPKRGAEGFDEKLVTLHSGILGASALLAAFPYEVPDWMPSLIVETVAQHTDDPVPISTTVRRCAADFKRTHQDTWSEDQHKFGEYLAEVNDFTLGRSDYFA